MNYYSYFSEIEETFIRRRGRSLLLSPLDWALIETWQERGVPLHIILRGIEKIFDGIDKQPARKRTVKSLMYCREEIEARYAEWLEARVGEAEIQSPKSEVQTLNSREDLTKSELFPDETIAAHLEKVTVGLKSARNKANGDLRQTLEKALRRLEELAENFSDTEILEENLEKLDASIDETLLRVQDTTKLQKEIGKELENYRHKMEANVYQRTFDLMMLKRLREKTGVPRLSLFYL